MTEYFRVTGLHDINFDEGATGPYRLTMGRPPRDMSTPMTKREVIVHLDRLPKGVRSQALNRGMSMVTFPINIQADREAGETDTDMEGYLHDLIETLVDAALFIETKGTRGTRAVLRYKSDTAVENSYKTIYHATVTESGGRDVLGAKIKTSYLENLQLTIYMEPKWRPATAITLGPNEIYCPSFEEDGNADGRADDWAGMAASVLAMETTIVLHGCQSQKVTTNAANEGIQSTIMAAPGGVNDAVAYVWIARPGVPPQTDIEASIRDTTAGADRATALYSTATTIVTVGGYQWRRLELIATGNIIPGNQHRLRVYSTIAAATDWYADKAFWKWDTTTIPDEWCDHRLIYNHYDTTEGAAHEGHINYYDVDDLKGDTEARLLTRVEFEQKADEDEATHLIVGRRSRPDYCSFLWWWEAEDANVVNNWAVQALARCSAGNCVSNAANVSGYRRWDNVTMGLTTMPHEGRFDVYAAVYTDDVNNTQYRLAYRNLLIWSYNKWVKPTIPNVWELIRLGEINLQNFFRDGAILGGFDVQVDYEKDAADTAKLDFIWLVPKDEPETYLENAVSMVDEGEWWVLSRSEDFDYQAEEYDAPPLYAISRLNLRGEAMSLAPRKENRLYFVCLTYDLGVGDIYEAHGAATDLQMIVNIDYLPQYVSPLE